MTRFLIIAVGVCVIFADLRSERRDSATRDDIARAREESARRLERIQADLDALKADVNATGIACETQRSPR